MQVVYYNVFDDCGGGTFVEFYDSKELKDIMIKFRVSDGHADMSPPESDRMDEGELVLSSESHVVVESVTNNINAMFLMNTRVKEADGDEDELKYVNDTFRAITKLNIERSK